MRARDEFYRVLADDLTLYGNRSVLYEYLETEQEKRAAGGEKNLEKARSYQLRIRYYRRQLKEGAISPENYLKELLEVLIQKPQFAKSPGKRNLKRDGERIVGYISEDPEPLIRELLRPVLAGAGSEERDGYMQEIRQVYGILDGRKGSAYKRMQAQLKGEGVLEPPYEKLMIVTDAVLDVALAYDIKEFFFDTAVEKQRDYTVVKRQKEAGEKAGGGRAERTDKSLKLMESYCLKRGKSLFGEGVGKESGDMECDRLYRSLRERENEEVFVPLVIDPQTGCSICLIGRAYFEEGDTPGSVWHRDLKESCAYGVLFFDNDFGEDIKTGYHISNSFGEFPNYNAARFEGEWCYEQMRQEAGEVFRESNGAMPAGIPEIFRRYFLEDTDREEEEIRREIRVQTEEQERMLREEEKDAAT